MFTTPSHAFASMVFLRRQNKHKGERAKTQPRRDKRRQPNLGKSACDGWSCIVCHRRVCLRIDVHLNDTGRLKPPFSSSKRRWVTSTNCVSLLFSPWGNEQHSFFCAPKSHNSCGLRKKAGPTALLLLAARLVKNIWDAQKSKTKKGSFLHAYAWLDNAFLTMWAWWSINQSVNIFFLRHLSDAPNAL